MFGRIARVVGNLFTVVDDTKPSNRVRLGLTQLEDRATPAAFVVNTTRDDFDDDNPGDGKAGTVVARTGELLTSLRSAIQEGNALTATGKGNDHTITFDTKAMGAASIPLSKALPTLQANFSITGGAVQVTVVRPTGSAHFRIFDIAANRDVSFSYLGINNGRTAGSGGGIQNQGNLTIDNCEIYNNYAGDGGGGVFSDGKLSISYSQVWNNEAVELGGGIFVGTGCTNFTLDQSQVYENEVTAKLMGFGGGLAIYGSSSVDFVALLTDSTITDNDAASHGGGFYASVCVDISDCEITWNRAVGYGGGGYINTDKTLTSKWIGGTVSDNSAGEKGGGFYVKSGILLFENLVSFVNNKATKGFAGGAYLPPLGEAKDQGLPAGSQTVDPDQ
jgi:predicted outer membrane repeat protein